MRIDLIYTFFEGEQEWFETDLPEAALSSAFDFGIFLLKHLLPSQQAMLCKVSCCIIGRTEETIPEWFMECNGKFWFNEEKRKEYGLN